MSVVGGVEIKDGKPVDKWFGIEMFEDKLYSSIAVVTGQQSEFRVSDCEDFRLKRYPGYGFSENDNVPRVFNIHLSSEASAQNLEHAYHFDLGCLRSWRSCKRLSDLVPDAWADLEDDNKWMDSNRDRLQDGGPLKDTRCNYR